MATSAKPTASAQLEAESPVFQMCMMDKRRRFLSKTKSPLENKFNEDNTVDDGSASTPLSSSTSSSELPADFSVPFSSPDTTNTLEASKDAFPKPDLHWGNTKLYDRSQQVDSLRAAFFRRWPLADTDTPSSISDEERSPGAELVLISGYSGTGKTVLARQVMQDLIKENKPSGYCIIGKYDQELDHYLFQDDNVDGKNTSEGFEKDIFNPSAQPYSAFVAALTDLAERWESEGPEKLLEIREKLGAKTADGGMGDDLWNVLRIFVPALQCVFNTPDSSDGQQKASQEKLSENEQRSIHGAQQDRLLVSLTYFFQTVFSPSHPAVLMLDDLQWCDSGSLELLEALTCDPDLFDKLMVIGICRDNEVPYHHEFACLLRRLEDAKGATITNIEVRNLSLRATVELLTDLLRQPGDLCEEVAKVIHEKTKGNCFFTLQVLKALFEEGVLIAKDSTWVWHRELWNQLFGAHDLSACGLVFRRLQRLPEACQNLLKTASCFAGEIDKEILHSTAKDVYKEDETCDFDTALGIVVEEELLVPSHQRKPGKLVFAHDRIQQASYALIPDALIPDTHVSIGRSLYEMVLASKDDSLLSEYIFLIVKQLICGVSLMDENDKTGLAALCLRAGREAARSSAFLMAVQYFKLGTSFLPLRSWRDEYDLCLELYSSLAEAQCCTTDFDAMEETIQAILEHGRNEQDKLRAYSTRIYSYAARMKLNEAIEMGVDVLSKSFGESFPKNPNMIHLLVDLARTKWKLRNLSDEDIMNLPTIAPEHEDKLAAQNILLVLMNHCFMSAPDFFPFVSLRLINITLEYGLSAHASNSFVCFALFILAMDEVDTGYRFGSLGIRLLREKFQDTVAEWLPKAYSIHYSCVAIWKQPIRECLWGLHESYTVGRKSGDAEAVAVAAQFISENKFYAGFPLSEVCSDLDRLLPVMAMYKQGPFFVSSRQLKELVLNLMGKVKNQLKDTSHLTDSIETAEVFNTLGTLDCEIKIHRLILNYHLGNYEEALQMAIASRKAEQELKPVYSYSVQFFYDAMTSLALAWESKRGQRVSHARKILKKLEKLEGHCAANLRHMVCMIKAELGLLTWKKNPKNIEKTMALYKAAIESATKEGFLHMIALGLERAGVALLHFRLKSEGNDYLKQAKQAYQDWGAQVIVDSFQKRYVC